MESPRESGGKGVFITVGLLIAVYIFVPFVFAAPLMALQKTGLVSEGKINQIGSVVFAPLGYLARIFPPYQALLQAEAPAFEIFR